MYSQVAGVASLVNTVLTTARQTVLMHTSPCTQFSYCCSDPRIRHELREPRASWLSQFVSNSGVETTVTKLCSNADLSHTYRVCSHTPWHFHYAIGCGSRFTGKGMLCVHHGQDRQSWCIPALSHTYRGCSPTPWHIHSIPGGGIRITGGCCALHPSSRDAQPSGRIPCTFTHPLYCIFILCWPRLVYSQAPWRLAICRWRESRHWWKLCSSYTTARANSRGA